MFKNKKFEVKVVDDKPTQTPETHKPRISKEDILLLKDTVKIIGAVWLSAVVIDAIARVAVADRENQHKEN